MAGEIIDVDDLLDSLDYTKETNETVQMAFGVMRAVNIFLRERKCSVLPFLEISPTTISLSIDEVCCWHSETHNTEVLTVGAVLSEYEAACRERLKGFDPACDLSEES